MSRVLTDVYFDLYQSLLKFEITTYAFSGFPGPLAKLFKTDLSGTSSFFCMFSLLLKELIFMLQNYKVGEHIGFSLSVRSFVHPPSIRPSVRSSDDLEL